MKYGTMYCFLPAFFDSRVEDARRTPRSRRCSACASSSSTSGSVCSGATFRCPPTWCCGQFPHVLRRAAGQVHADAAGDQHLLDARRLAGLLHQFDRAGRGRCRAACRSSDARTTAAGRSLRPPGCVHRIWYMLAVGPPMSLMMPLNSGSAAILLDFARGPTPCCATE